MVARNPANRLTSSMSSTPGLRCPVATLITCAERATSVNTEIANRKFSDASRKASGCGSRRGSITPIWSLELSREERMPPRAPVSSRNAGSSTRSAGNLRKKSWARDSMAVPASISMEPATKSTTIDSRMIRRASGRSVRSPRAIATRHAPPARIPTASVTTCDPEPAPGRITRNDAAQSAGSVHVSPIAVTSGAETESRSHPRR